MEEKYLPVGSVCMLKGGQKAVMVVGYGIQPKENPNVVYDYLGALYPEGIVTMDQNMVFNHENIDRVLFKGYETEEQKSFNKQIIEIIGQMKNSSVVNNNAAADSIPTIQNNNQDFNEQKIIPVDNNILSNEKTQSSTIETLSSNQNAATYVPPFSSFGDTNNNV